MLARRPHTAQSLARDQHGFTLIELLISMLMATVVIGALFEIFIVSLHQTSRITDSVQATQLGRTAMTRMVDELHSACIAREFAPVQGGISTNEGSNANQLIFRNAYSEEAVIPKAYEHQLVWNSTAHTVTDFIYENKIETGSEWPNFKFPSTDYVPSTREAKNATPAKGILLASNVTEAEPEGKKVAVFRYYEYATKPDNTTTEELEAKKLYEEKKVALSTLKEVKAPAGGFSEPEADKIAAVTITFSTAPIDGETTLSRQAEFSSQVLFSFSTPSSEAKIEDGPCQ